MRILLEENLAECTTLDELQFQTQATFAELRADGYEIDYIAGPISCDGDEKISENLGLLIAARTRIMHESNQGVLTFTAPFIFTPEVYTRLEIFSMDRTEREVAMGDFWDSILMSGHIGAVLFRRGWERSPGSRRERSTAELLNIAIVDLDF